MDSLALNKLGYGLYILTSHSNGKDNGCIVNTVSQVTYSPDKIMVCVNNDSYTCSMIKESGIFNVSVLREDTPFYVFEHFGFFSGREKNKFEKTDNLFRTENGAYVLPKFANAYMCGEVCSTIDLGRHTMFIADIKYQYVLSEDPSITYAYYHENTKPKKKETDKKGYICDICGYILESGTLPDDFVCPICKHPASDFSKL